MPWDVLHYGQPVLHTGQRRRQCLRPVGAAFTGDAGNLTVEPNPVLARNGTATSATLSWTRLSLGENGIRTLANVQVGAPAGGPSIALAQAVPGA